MIGMVIFAAIELIFIILCNYTWYKLAEDQNEDWADFCSKLNKDWSKYCEDLINQFYGKED